MIENALAQTVGLTDFILTYLLNTFNLESNSSESFPENREGLSLYDFLKRLNLLRNVIGLSSVLIIIKPIRTVYIAIFSCS